MKGEHPKCETIILDLNLKAKQSSATSPADPMVGIWWASERKLVGLTQPAEAAEISGDFLDSPLQHIKEWSKVAAEFGYRAKDEYFLVPRGRVLLRAKSRHGVIYHGNATNTETLATIARVFGLNEWTCSRDEHYLFGAEADELFDDYDEEEDI
jgi:hypothetical protein